jgi:ApaG protein
MDMTRGEIDVDILDFSDLTTNNVRVQVSTSYNAAQSDPPMRKHSFAYTIRITNVSSKDVIQLLSRKFEIQTVGARQKDVIKGEGVTGRQPILKPGEAFEYTSSAPLSVRPLGTTIAAARMAGEYQFNIVDIDESAGKDAEGNPIVKVLNTDGPLSCQLGMFHFVFTEDQRVKPVRRASEDDDDDDDDEDATTTSSKAALTGDVSASTASSGSTANKPSTSVASTPSLPGDEDMKTGKILMTTNDSSETTTDGVKVKVTSQYREERSDPKMDKHCFAYNIRITNENEYAIQLTGRKFEIQTIGSSHKDVVAGPGVTGRQPVLQPGESFEYTSTAPLSVHPLPTTSVVARMQGEYTFTKVGDNQARQAKLAVFHFVLPVLV